MMRRYRLYVSGIGFINSDGKMVSYTVITNRNAKKAARDYGRDVLITDMHGRVVSGANIDENGNPYNINCGEVVI